MKKCKNKLLTCVSKCINLFSVLVSNFSKENLSKEVPDYSKSLFHIGPMVTILIKLLLTCCCLAPTFSG